eukprot:m.124448 g.124448  ORF g.124448 m.124448 type:complete len:52 (+) comp15708_c0_seq6:2469-2624(+)
MAVRQVASRVLTSFTRRQYASYDVSFHGKRAVVTGGTKGSLNLVFDRSAKQ